MHSCVLCLLHDQSLLSHTLSLKIKGLVFKRAANDKNCAVFHISVKFGVLIPVMT